MGTYFNPNNKLFRKSLQSKIYIDKTETIYNLLDNEERIFISRPRRFCKYLTLDTIATLFEKGVEPYFKSKSIFAISISYLALLASYL